MGAQKKCQLIIFTVLYSFFVLYFLLLLIENIYASYKSKSKINTTKEAWIVFIICDMFLCIPFIILINYFKYDVKFKLVYKKKNSELNKIGVETNNINNINNEGEYFIKRTEYKFKNTKIRRRYTNKFDYYKKVVSCISILSDGKIILGFTEGTILVCTINEITCELMQNFSFNRFKLHKILYICESLVNDGEIMVSVKDNALPIKVIKLNLDYKYSLIKELARDKPYLVSQEIAKKNNMNNINNMDDNDSDDNYVFKILSFKNDKYLLCDQKGLLLKEKVFDLNCEEYVSTNEYICNNNNNEAIYDIIKINEDYVVTLETKDINSNIYFYKIKDLSKENKFIENVLSSSTQVKSNRLCFINESLISVIDNNSVLFINIVYKEKIKVLEIDNIIGIGADFFYDGGIIFLRNNYLNTLNVPYIVKIKKNQGNIEEYNSFSLTNTIQDYKDTKTKIKYCESKLKFIKCLRNVGIVLLGNEQGKIFIWEEIDKSKSHNNANNTIII